jgi:hypothetical protein
VGKREYDPRSVKITFAGIELNPDNYGEEEACPICMSGHGCRCGEVTPIVTPAGREAVRVCIGLDITRIALYDILTLARRHYISFVDPGPRNY